MTSSVGRLFSWSNRLDSWSFHKRPVDAGMMSLSRKQIFLYIGLVLSYHLPVSRGRILAVALRSLVLLFGELRGPCETLAVRRVRTELA